MSSFWWTRTAREARSRGRRASNSPGSGRLATQSLDAGHLPGRLDLHWPHRAGNVDCELANRYVVRITPTTDRTTSPSSTPTASNNSARRRRQDRGRSITRWLRPSTGSARPNSALAAARGAPSSRSSSRRSSTRGGATTCASMESSTCAFLREVEAGYYAGPDTPLGTSVSTPDRNKPPGESESGSETPDRCPLKGGQS